jgi:hypothetical protein
LIPNSLFALCLTIPRFVPLPFPDEFIPRRTMPNARENKLLAEGSQHFLWRMTRNATEPAKILDFAFEQVPDSMHMHGCYQARVMDLDTGDLLFATTILRHC